MSPSFVRSNPLQALKLGAVLGVLGFGVAGVAGLLPGRGLGSLLVLAFFPMGLAVLVAAEALHAGYRLARLDERGDRLRERPWYTAVRAIEVVVTILAPAAFYVLIVQIGGEVAGPGAIGLLFVGIALGLVAFGGVLLRTLVEYYYHRRSDPPATPVGPRNDASE